MKLKLTQLIVLGCKVVGQIAQEVEIGRTIRIFHIDDVLIAIQTVDGVRHCVRMIRRKIACADRLR